MIELTVYGTPGPQGSKRFVGISKSGRGVMVESSKKVAVWREAIKWAFLERYGQVERPVVRGPVALYVTFFLARSKSVKRKLPSVRPDLSKLVRSTEDALTEIGAWQDDACVVDTMSRKRYAGPQAALSSPGALIHIVEVENG